MVKNLAMKPFQSSFLSCEKDAEIILRKLFIESRPYSDDLKRLLVINTRDCLDDKTNPIYLKKIEEMNLQKLVEQGYIRFSPKLQLQEHSEVKAYIFISFDEFTPNIKNYRERPIKIVGLIDGILENSRLTGIGTFQMVRCDQQILSSTLSGYSLVYRAIHGSDDKLPESDKIV